MLPVRGPRPHATVQAPGLLPTPGYPSPQSRFARTTNPIPNVENLNLREEEERDPNVSKQRLEEFRRSLFVPSIPVAVSTDELGDVFRTFGNLQDYIVKDTGNNRYAIVIFVEPESAYDVLCSKIIVNERVIHCEPRNIGGRNYPPLVPMDVETPARIQTAPGSGRGVPYSVVADHLPVVPGSAYSYDAFPPLGSSAPRSNGPVATRVPAPNPRPMLISGLAHLLQGTPLPLPMAQPPAASARPPQPAPSMMAVLKRMPFLAHTANGLEQMLLLVHHIELKESELRAREQVSQILEQTFRRIFRNCNMRMYGSSANTFGVRGSDIDAYLDLNLDSEEARRDFPPRQRNVSYYSKNITELQRQPYEPGELKYIASKDILLLMERLMRYLAKLHDWDYIHAIPEARTPILKLHQAHSNMSVDISFSSKFVFQNTGLLILYSHMDPRVRPLVYTLRRWAESKQLTGDTAFTKYALTMLLVFFLHHTKPVVLPTPEQITFWVESERQRWIPGYGSADADTLNSVGLPSFSFDQSPQQIYQFAKRFPPSLNTASADQLLLQFFTYYSDFSFTSHVMCGYSGEITPISSFPIPPEGFKFRYVNMQDPFDLSHNIAKSVSLHTFTSFREFLRQEVAVFTRLPLNLVLLFDIEYTEAGIPDYPVMIPITPRRNYTIGQDDWVSLVADFTRKILLELFFCEFANDITDAEFESFPFGRTIHRLGPVYRHFHCRIECQSWMKRRNVRKTLTKTLKPPAGLQDEWDNEAAIGAHLHKTTYKAVEFEFYVSVVANTVETEKACVFLTCSKKTAHIREFFDILWKFLPEQTRRYLKLPKEFAPTTAEIPFAPAAGNGMAAVVSEPATDATSTTEPPTSLPPPGDHDNAARGRGRTFPRGGRGKRRGGRV